MPNGWSSSCHLPLLASTRVEKRMWLQMPFQRGILFFLFLFREAKVLSFHTIQELYKEDPDFKEVLQGDLKGHPYFIQEGYLLKNNKLCIPRSPKRDYLVCEARGGALASHFGLNKIINILKEHFIGLKWEVKFTRWCSIFHKAKSQFHQGLYTPLPVPI